MFKLLSINNLPTIHGLGSVNAAIVADRWHRR